jgi:hypothetical protein
MNNNNNNRYECSVLGSVSDSDLIICATQDWAEGRNMQITVRIAYDPTYYTASASDFLLSYRTPPVSLFFSFFRSFLPLSPSLSLSSLFLLFGVILYLCLLFLLYIILLIY